MSPILHGNRVGCVQVPLFPLAARLRSEPELREEAVAIIDGQGDKALIVAATRRARRAGIRPDMTLTQARIRLPKLIARPRDPECERAAQEALLDVTEGFSPRIEDAGNGRAYLDLDGLERLYAGERPEHDLGQDLLRVVEQQAGMPARLGIASSKLSASLAAAQSPSPMVVAPGKEIAFLAPLPLDHLNPRAQVLKTLRRWGIGTLGDFANLPEAEVISRLGEVGRELHAVARGEDPRPLVPRTPPPVFQEGMELEWPLVNLEPFLFVAHAALERLTARMQGQALGCKRLELSMELEDHGRHERSIELPAPTRDVKTLLTLLRLDLEATSPGAPVLAFQLTAHPDRPREAQLSLFGPEALSPDRLATTLGRLFALLGKDRVGSPRLVDGHRPERFALVPYAPPPPPKERPDRRPNRGLLTLRVLRPPLAVDVTSTPPQRRPQSHRAAGTNNTANTADTDPLPSIETLCPEDRPLAIEAPATPDPSGPKRPKIRGAVKIASGPWALEESWWDSRPTQRDYWDVELQSGGLYRLYRDRHDGAWFVDGIYD